MILGVSGWVGERTGIKESNVRIAFVLSVLLFGFGIGLYLILWIVKLLSK
jgi:phage shock protein PspC (stress-responsive transcriptional regulator)